MAAAVLSAGLSTLAIFSFSSLVSSHRSTTNPELGSGRYHTYSPGYRDQQPWVSNRTAQNILTYLHASYPIIVLALFITVFTIRSIALANRETEAAPVTTQVGPGGKPLPRKSPASKSKNSEVLDFSRPRKLLFEWLSLAVAMTFVANSIQVIIHALYAREEEWWCGETTVVCLAWSENLRAPSDFHRST